MWVRSQSDSVSEGEVIKGKVRVVCEILNPKKEMK